MTGRSACALLLLVVAGCAARIPPAVEPPDAAVARSAPAAADPPAAEPAAQEAETTPRLLPEPGGTPEPAPGEDLGGEIARLDGILTRLQGLSLTDPQREQLEAGSAFVAQARQALAESDSERAAILIVKGRTLIEDLERTALP